MKLGKEIDFQLNFRDTFFCSGSETFAILLLQEGKFIIVLSFTFQEGALVDLDFNTD